MDLWNLEEAPAEETHFMHISMLSLTVAVKPVWKSFSSVNWHF